MPTDSTDRDKLRSVSRGVRDSYGTAPALAKYQERVAQGLRIWEETVIDGRFPASGSVIVVGCGAGRELFSLQQRGYLVHGLDVSGALLRAARRIGKDRGWVARVALTDGVLLPCASRSADVVTLWSQVLGNVPGHRTRLSLLTEAHRVLRPGGVLALSVHDRDRTLPLVDPAKTSQVDDPEPGDFCLREDDEDTTRYWHYFEMTELGQLCHEAGFARADIVHTSDLGQQWGNVLVAICAR